MYDLYEVLEQAMERLTERLGRGCEAVCLHPVDQSVAKLLFKELYQRGVPFERHIVVRLAHAQGWHTDNAKQLGEWAERIGRGGPVRVQFKTDWATKVMNELMP